MKNTKQNLMKIKIILIISMPKLCQKHFLSYVLITLFGLFKDL